MTTFKRNEFRLLVVTELDYDGPEIAILTIALINDRFHAINDLGVVIQRDPSTDEWILTALTSTIDDEDVLAVAAAEWLETMVADVLPGELRLFYTMMDARGVVTRELGLECVDWRVLDQHYADRRTRPEAA